MLFLIFHDVISLYNYVKYLELSQVSSDPFSSRVSDLADMTVYFSHVTNIIVILCYFNINVCSQMRSTKIIF